MAIDLVTYALDQLGVTVTPLVAYLILIVGGLLSLGGVFSGVKAVCGLVQRSKAKAEGPFHFPIEVVGQNVVIHNMEENPDNISITGTVSGRQSAVVLNKRRLASSLSPKQRLEEYASALVDADMKKRM